MTFRTKLLLSHVAVVIATVALLGLSLDRSLRHDLEQQRAERLTSQARGALDWVSAGRHPERVAERLSAILQTDVTIFDARGCVVGSSRGRPEVATCAPPPEVLAAQGAGLGQTSRAEDGVLLDFVALRSQEGQVLRLGAPRAEIDAPIAAMRRRLVAASAAGGIVAILLGFLAARVASRPLASMATEAARIARGDYRVAFPALPDDEFGRLARTLAALATQLEVDMDRIAKLEATRRDFVANVTHELRTPLAAILACLETLEDVALPPSSREKFLDQAARHAARLSSLVDSLLTLAELEQRDAGPPPTEEADLLGVSREIAHTLASRAEERGVTIAIGDFDPTPVVGDPAQLEQIGENLVDNAIKYAAEGRSVELWSEAVDGRVVWSIADRGPGIDPAHRDRVFERFYRVDKGRSRDHGGAGLGLAIVKHLVERQGGTIAVGAREGGGAVFSVNLARAEPGGQPSKRPPPSA